MELFKRLQNLMINYRFKPDKRLGQHFCINKNLLEKIVEESNLKKEDKVIEIGPGTGFLTELMLKKCKVIGIEKDKTLAKLLQEQFVKDDNFTLIVGDYLKQEVNADKIVSLPPYNISDDIMAKVFEQKPELCVFVFQKEFVEKLVAEPGFHEYCYLSVISSVFYNADIPIRNISPNCFYPKPEAYSSLIKLKRKKEIVKINTKSFVFFLKQIFRFKNKTLENALKYAKIKHKKSFLKENHLLSTKVNLVPQQKYVEIFRKIFQE